MGTNFIKQFECEREKRENGGGDREEVFFQDRLKQV